MLINYANWCRNFHSISTFFNSSWLIKLLTPQLNYSCSPRILDLLYYHGRKAHSARRGGGGRIVLLNSTGYVLFMTQCPCPLVPHLINIIIIMITVWSIHIHWAPSSTSPEWFQSERRSRVLYCTDHFQRIEYVLTFWVFWLPFWSFIKRTLYGMEMKTNWKHGGA